MACEAADCDRPVYARGHCSRHYKQLLRHGLVQPDRAPAECAYEVLRRYDPELGAALGWDLDPETGAPDGFTAEAAN